MFLNNRYYDPALGRFTSVDPLAHQENPQSLNPYTYSLNNPTTYSDPTGLDPCILSGGCAQEYASQAEQVRINHPCGVAAGVLATCNPNAGKAPEPLINTGSTGPKKGPVTELEPKCPTIYTVSIDGLTIGGGCGGGSTGSGWPPAGGGGGLTGGQCGDGTILASCTGGGTDWTSAVRANGAAPEGDSPVGTVFKEGGVWVYINSNDHAPPHAHVEGGGPDTRIGQNGHPLAGDPELSSKQRDVIVRNIDTIRDAIGGYMRWFREEKKDKP